MPVLQGITGFCHSLFRKPFISLLNLSLQLALVAELPRGQPQPIFEGAVKIGIALEAAELCNLL